MTSARSYPNIALIKYWGNRNDALRLPAGDSLSITLDSPSVRVDVKPAETFAVRSFREDGTEKNLSDVDARRFTFHWGLMNRYLQEIESVTLPENVSLEVHSSVPPGIGLASSAAVFSAVGKAAAGFITQTALSDVQVSVLARLGSGSAARSIFGGFVALHAGESDELGASTVQQIAPPHHWPLTDIILAPDTDHKKVGSTEGHAGVWTSPLYRARLDAIASYRQRDCIEAILTRDFEKLRAMAEEDALDMHRVMESQDPPLQYLSEETHRIIRDIEHLRSSEHLPVLYTMDAGPTVHLICDEPALERVRAYAKEQKNCLIFEAGIGSGAREV